jgi:hypothetical protein
MVVGVDKSRQQHLTAGAKNWGLRMFRGQLGGWTNFGDDPVALQHRAVFDLMPMAAVCGIGNDGAGADDAGGHDFSPELSRKRPYL